MKENQSVRMVELPGGVTYKDWFPFVSLSNCVEDRVDLERGGTVPWRSSWVGGAGGRNGGEKRGDRLLSWVAPHRTAWLPEGSRHAGRHDSFKSRATPHGTTHWRVTPKYVARLSLTRSAELPAWHVGRAKHVARPFSESHHEFWHDQKG